jgi:hypothetical protein
VVAKNPERLRGVAGDEDGLAMCQEMANEVGDRMRFASARGPLNQDSAVVMKALDDLELLLVDGLAEESVPGVEASRMARGMTITRRIVDAGDPGERRGDLCSPLDVTQDALEHSGEPGRPRPDEEHRPSVELRVVLCGRLLGGFVGDSLCMEQLRNAPEERVRRLPEKWMDGPAKDLLSTLRQPGAVDPGKAAEEGSVELLLAFQLGDPKLRYVRVELELNALQKYRMMGVAARILPDEESVSQDELDSFGLSLKPTVELVQTMEQPVCPAQWDLLASPLLALLLPPLEGGHSRRRVAELLVALLAGRRGNRGSDIVLGNSPTGFEPTLELDARWRTLGEPRPSHPKDETGTPIFCACVGVR